MYPDPQLIPIAKVDVEGVSPGAATNILAADITPSRPPSTFRISVAVDADCKFIAIVTVDSTSYTVDFNHGTVLSNVGLYKFDLLVHTGDSVNFQLGSDETVILLRVQEIPTSI